MPVTVRTAERSELERVNELRRMVSDLHVNGRPDVFRQGFCDELAQQAYGQCGASDSDILVAVMDHAICGFAVVEYVETPQTPYCCARRFYHIKEFGVDEGFRRKGVATALVSFMKSDARKRGFPKLELDMWEFNDGARFFYEAVGFKTYRRCMDLDL